MKTKLANDIEAHRAFWANIARENGWYEEPFYVQVWRDFDGVITDSVSVRSLTQDWDIQTKTIECPNHEGNFDCTPFCNLCEGEQEITK
jgi:hypothetical protein